VRLGRYDDAVRAWQNVIANLGDNADREENLGESLIAAADGAVTKDAKNAFDRSLSMDPGNVAARFYTGLAAKQEGRRDAAAEIWRDLIAKASPDAEWADTVRDALARLEEPSVATGDSPQRSEDQPNCDDPVHGGWSSNAPTDRWSRSGRMAQACALLQRSR
jgi:cytochrome c-type biogenesis protein CcmH/NrfG